MSVCGERFFVNCPATPDNACQLPKGHDGCHVTGMSEIYECGGLKMRSNIRFGEAHDVAHLALAGLLA